MVGGGGWRSSPPDGVTGSNNQDNTVLAVGSNVVVSGAQAGMRAFDANTGFLLWGPIMLQGVKGLTVIPGRDGMQLLARSELEILSVIDAYNGSTLATGTMVNFLGSGLVTLDSMSSRDLREVTAHYSSMATVGTAATVYVLTWSATEERMSLRAFDTTDLATFNETAELSTDFGVACPGATLATFHGESTQLNTEVLVLLCHPNRDSVDDITGHCNTNNCSYATVGVNLTTDRVLWRKAWSSNHATHEDVRQDMFGMNGTTFLRFHDLQLGVKAVVRAESGAVVWQTASARHEWKTVHLALSGPLGLGFEFIGTGTDGSNGTTSFDSRVGTDRHDLHAYDLHTGVSLYTVATPILGCGLPTAVFGVAVDASRRRLYATLSDSRVFAFDPATGSVLWVWGEAVAMSEVGLNAGLRWYKGRDFRNNLLAVDETSGRLHTADLMQRRAAIAIGGTPLCSRPMASASVVKGQNWLHGVIEDDFGNGLLKDFGDGLDFADNLPIRTDMNEWSISRRDTVIYRVCRSDVPSFNPERWYDGLHCDEDDVGIPSSFAPGITVVTASQDQIVTAGVHNAQLCAGVVNITEVTPMMPSDAPIGSVTAGSNSTVRVNASAFMKQGATGRVVFERWQVAELQEALSGMLLTPHWTAETQSMSNEFDAKLADAITFSGRFPDGGLTISATVKDRNAEDGSVDLHGTVRIESLRLVCPGVIFLDDVGSPTNVVVRAAGSDPQDGTVFQIRRHAGETESKILLEPSLAVRETAIPVEFGSESGTLTPSIRSSADLSVRIELSDASQVVGVCAINVVTINVSMSSAIMGTEGAVLNSGNVPIVVGRQRGIGRMPGAAQADESLEFRVAPARVALFANNNITISVATLQEIFKDQSARSETFTTVSIGSTNVLAAGEFKVPLQYRVVRADTTGGWHWVGGQPLNVTVALGAAASSGGAESELDTGVYVIVNTVTVLLVVVLLALAIKQLRQRRKLRQAVDFTEMVGGLVEPCNRNSRFEASSLTGVRPSRTVSNDDANEQAQFRDRQSTRRQKMGRAQGRAMSMSPEHRLGQTRADRAVGDGPVIPVEIPRSRVNMIAQIGAGQFGLVFRALFKPRGAAPEHMVAVKQLKAGPSDDQKQEFLAECSLTAQFDHSNVIGMLGVVTRGSPFLLVLQYCDKGSLDQLLRTQGTSTERLTEFTLGIISGLEYLALKKFVHRDIAARNVLIDAKDEPKIADFGLSRDMDEGTYYTSSNPDQVLPLRWCAPEVLVSQRFSEKSDVWSFGITVLELFNRGAIPFAGHTNTEVVTILTQTGGFVPVRPQGCPMSLWPTVCLALKTDPGARPTFTELFDGLTAAVSAIASDLPARHSSIDLEAFRAAPTSGDAAPARSETAPYEYDLRVAAGTTGAVPPAQGAPLYSKFNDVAVCYSAPPEWASAGLASSGRGTDSPSLFTNYSGSTGAVSPTQGAPLYIDATDAAVCYSAPPEWASAGLSSSGRGTDSPSLFTNYSGSTGAVSPAQDAPMNRDITDAAVCYSPPPEWASAGLASSGLGTDSPSLFHSTNNAFGDVTLLLPFRTVTQNSANSDLPIMGSMRSISDDSNWQSAGTGTSVPALVSAVDRAKSHSNAGGWVPLQSPPLAEGTRSLPANAFSEVRDALRMSAPHPRRTKPHFNFEPDLRLRLEGGANGSTTVGTPPGARRWSESCAVQPAAGGSVPNSPLLQKMCASPLVEKERMALGRSTDDLTAGVPPDFDVAGNEFEMTAPRACRATPDEPVQASIAKPSTPTMRSESLTVEPGSLRRANPTRGSAAAVRSNDRGPTSNPAASAPMLTLHGDGQGGVGHHTVLFESTL